jgi:hypothetical protein
MEWYGLDLFGTGYGPVEESLKIKKLGGKVLPARRADNLAAIY